jgi:hypothetical protein
MGNYDGEGFKFCQLGEVVNCDHHHYHIPIPPLWLVQGSLFPSGKWQCVGDILVCWDIYIEHLAIFWHPSYFSEEIWLHGPWSANRNPASQPCHWGY